MKESFLPKLIKTIEHLFLTFAIPASIMMAAVEARYTAEHGFWFFYILLLVDTLILMAKEKFGSMKTRDIDNFKKGLVWYKAYSIVMVLQFVLGIFTFHGIGVLLLYSLTLLLFSTRFMVYKRTIAKAQGQGALV